MSFLWVSLFSLLKFVNLFMDFCMKTAFYSVKMQVVVLLDNWKLLKTVKLSMDFCLVCRVLLLKSVKLCHGLFLGKNDNSFKYKYLNKDLDFLLLLYRGRLSFEPLGSVFTRLWYTMLAAGIQLISARCEQRLLYIDRSIERINNWVAKYRLIRRGSPSSC